MSNLNLSVGEKSIKDNKISFGIRIIEHNVLPISIDFEYAYIGKDDAELIINHLKEQFGL